MGLPNLTPYVAGQPVSATQANANEQALRAAFGALDNSNNLAHYFVFPVHFRFYFQAAVGGGDTRWLVLPPFVGFGACMYLGVSFNRVATTNDRTLQLIRFTRATATPDAVDYEHVFTIPHATTFGSVDGTAAAVDVINKGIIVAFGCPIGTVEVDEYLEGDVWFAGTLEKQGEL